MRFAMEVKPRFDYGRAPHKLEISANNLDYGAGNVEPVLARVRGATAL